MTSSQTHLGEPVPENVTPLETQARQAVRRVFATLKTAFPAWYEKHYGDQKAEQMARRVWLSVIKDFGDEAINRGLHRMVQECKFPPAPSDFADMCKRVDDLPTTGEAWDQALTGKYLHEAVRVAAIATSTFDLKTAKQGDKALFQRFERNYAIVLRRAQTGQPLTGHIAIGIGNDAARPREQIQLEHSHKLAEMVIHDLQIPTDPKAARAMLLKQLHIRRDPHA
ncbi:replication protein P [Pseudomonas sp. RC10]|uniref:replication protein P n=1 Tax=Pseudomonas bambusae TaxID=3139142 RepID=UPI00313973F3